MDKKTRRQHSPEDKVRILRLHLLEHQPVSELCDQQGIHPTLFYQWQKPFSRTERRLLTAEEAEGKSGGWWAGEPRPAPEV